MDEMDYVRRITGASPLELIIINYELLIQSIEDARRAAGDNAGYDRFLGKAKGFLQELIIGLDMGNPVAQELMPIYIFVNKLLIDAGVTKDTIKRKESLKEAGRIMSNLLSGWQNIPEEAAGDKPVQDSAPKVYAGLTYGKNGIAQEYATDQEDRGIKA